MSHRIGSIFEVLEPRRLQSGSFTIGATVPASVSGNLTTDEFMKDQHPENWDLSVTADYAGTSGPHTTTAGISLSNPSEDLEFNYYFGYYFDNDTSKFQDQTFSLTLVGDSDGTYDLSGAFGFSQTGSYSGGGSFTISENNLIGSFSTTYNGVFNTSAGTGTYTAGLTASYNQSAGTCAATISVTINW